MIAQLWNTNTPAIVSCEPDRELHVYFNEVLKYVFCWEVFNVRAFNQLAVNKSELYFEINKPVQKNLLKKKYNFIQILNL